ncbi:MAG: HYR domain-containing protein, partial [Verrucomicrobia bacterium]|nr:HYR domain-containing protein [Verrucomicrobiota bacterium]
DIVDGSVAVVCTPASGSTFALGTTTVSCTTTDVHGNTASGSFTVTVVDTTAPALTVPANMTVEATGPAGASVSFTTTATDIVDGSVAVVCTPASGSTFALGTTTVSCTTTDVHGNTANGSFTVTVQDTTAPALTLPASITVEATGPAGASVSFTATATDIVDGSAAVTCAPASGSTFALGTTTVSCTTTDLHGNTASGSFTVMVQDTTPPTLTVPANMTVEATGPAGASASFTATATDVVDGSIAAVCTPASGSTFTLGPTTVNCTATDVHGNTASGSFTVTVVDTTPPVISLPIVQPVECTSPAGATVAFAASALDLVDGTVAVVCNPPSGSTFPHGVTTVECTATDAHGNSSSGSFTATVVDTTPPTILCPPDVTMNADPGQCYALLANVPVGVPVATDTCGVASVVNDAPTQFPLGDTTVTWTVTDAHGLTATCEQTVRVLNPAPAATLTAPTSGSLYAVNTPVNFTATFTDAGGGTHTGTWTFDTISQAATIAEPSGATPGSATGICTFTAAGVYTVKLTLNDSCGASGTATQIDGMDLLVVVYDPSAGFVTGGGWINSPAGAYVADPTLTGKANFGFVSKYQKGADVPTGNTEFQFKAGNLNFSSTVYQWLVVSGAKAQYKGEGTINGAGDYGFLLTATDGQVSGGGGIDKFRIKIWDKASGAIVYDNVVGASDDIDSANPQALGGGSIVIHK